MYISHWLAISNNYFILFLERQSQGVIQLSNNKPGCAPDLRLFAQRLPVSITPELVVYIENDPENTAQPVATRPPFGWGENGITIHAKSRYKQT